MTSPNTAAAKDEYIEFFHIAPDLCLQNNVMAAVGVRNQSFGIWKTVNTFFCSE